MADKIKLVAAALIVAVAVAAYYYYSDVSSLYRFIGVLAALAVAVAIAVQTVPGRTAVGFLGEARNEVRKVVWPTRKETINTTLIVLAMVFVVGLFLFIVDWILLGAVKLLTIPGG